MVLYCCCHVLRNDENDSNMHRPQNRGNVTHYYKKIYENRKSNKLSALNDNGSSEQGTKFCYEFDSLMHPVVKLLLCDSVFCFNVKLFQRY